MGDRISIGANKMYAGRVEDITLRHTVIRNWENRMVIIPNAIISNETVINSSIIDEKVCSFFELGISYDSDMDLAMNIIKEEAGAHPNLIDNRSPEEIEQGVPKVVVRVMGYGESSINLRGYLWANTTTEAFIMSKDLYKTVKERFDKEGVEIPFPYRTLVFKNPLTTSQQQPKGQ
jgi:small-conductance mechanosensitive channel